ncbi:hypothetical protein [Photobacterium profundum]|uniref:hypothetical protein n=1 Tax=Photobacterium profundum TaxID=74109 RepID=UPI003D1049DD
MFSEVNMHVLDVEDILDKGVAQESSLTDIEWPIYIVAFFEYIADAQSWDHFFTYFMYWLPKLKQTLKLAGDMQSLLILKDYEGHFSKLGVKFTSNEIDHFLTSASNEYLDSCPDWREEFEACSIQRWSLISIYYSSIGVELKT